MSYSNRKPYQHSNCPYIKKTVLFQCAKVFKTKEGFQDHMKTQHMGIEEPRVQCTVCGAWLKNRGTLNKHMKIHTDSPQVCDICHKLKPTRTALNHHKRLVHGDASFHCTICKKTFKRQLSLTVCMLEISFYWEILIGDEWFISF